MLCGKTLNHSNSRVVIFFQVMLFLLYQLQIPVPLYNFILGFQSHSFFLKYHLPPHVGQPCLLAPTYLWGKRLPSSLHMPQPGCIHCSTYVFLLLESRDYFLSYCCYYYNYYLSLLCWNSIGHKKSTQTRTV